MNYYGNMPSNNIWGTNPDYLQSGDPVSVPVTKSMEDYDRAFRPGQEVIPPMDFANQRNMIHNNVAPNVLNEQVVEYTMVIDSSDRDIKFYPDPFNYKVLLNPLAFQSSHKKMIDPNTKKEMTDEMTKPVRPFITADVTNVKYIRFNTAVLPRSRNLNLESLTSGDPDVFDAKCGIKLDNDRFTILEIPELRGPMKFATSQHVSESYALLYNENIMNPNFYLATGETAGKYYPMFLKKLNHLTIQFKDSFGKPLKVDFLDKKIDTPATCICNNFGYTSAQKEKCSCKYVQHPLNPLLQNHITLTIGIMEDHVNMVTPYDDRLK